MTRRMLTREMTVDLQSLAGSMLLDNPHPNEEVLEVYRWIAVTADESGLRWRARDSWSHRRYPGIREELGLRRWTTYPTNEDGFGLCFTQRSFEFAPKIRETIVRAAFGNGPQVNRWRRDHGLRPTIQCRLYKRAELRCPDPLYRVYSDEPSRWVPHVKTPPKLNVGLNNIHPRCRDLFAFVLMPTEDGWRLEISVGQRDRRSRCCSEWRYYAGKWHDDDHPDIPAQRPNESTNAFLERACEYMRSILLVVPTPPRSRAEAEARAGEAAARAVAERTKGYSTFKVGRRFFAARDQQHAEMMAERSRYR